MTDKYRAFNFIHSDRQGSVVMVTDSAGQIEQHNSYYPYGEPHRALGRNTTQHIDAVQTENLIYRVMGLPYILDGTTHGNKSFINTHSKIPEFR